MSLSVEVGHAHEALVVHVVSGLCMAVMLVAVVPGWASRVGLLAFGAATAWCLLQAVRRFSPAVHLRLALCCLAMVAMLAPGTTAQVTTPTTTPVTMPMTMPVTAQMAAGHAVHGSTMAAAPTLPALVLAGALLVVATVLATRTRTVVRRGHRHPHPADVVEPLLAAVMAAMLVGVL